MTKTKFGHMACPDCSKPVVVKINERETLSYGCDECDGNGYCKKGEGRYSTWMGRITKVAPPVEPKAAPVASQPPPAPEKKPAAGKYGY